MQVAFPDADVPATQLSLLRSLSPAAHVALGRALAPLRQEGVLIVGSGMTFHNMQGLMSCIGGGSSVGEIRERSGAFDAWLSDTLGVGGAAADVTPEERLQRLQRWADAPHGAWLCAAARCIEVATIFLRADAGVLAFSATQRATATRRRSTCCRCWWQRRRRAARPRSGRTRKRWAAARRCPPSSGGSAARVLYRQHSLARTRCCNRRLRRASPHSAPLSAEKGAT